MPDSLDDDEQDGLDSQAHDPTFPEGMDGGMPGLPWGREWNND